MRSKETFHNTAAAQLEKAIEGLDERQATAFADLFHDFLDLHLAFFCNNRNERQQELAKRLRQDEKYKERFIAAVHAYGDAAEGYNDPLGDMFMRRISHGQNGQFFTPTHVCELMARILDPMAETINDPCCGSGRLILAGLKVARENGQEPTVYANDLSITCSKMALLNLLVNSACGEVSCGDSLRCDYENFRFFKIDRIHTSSSAPAISTYWQYTLADVEQVNEERKRWWYNVHLWGWWINANPTKENAREALKNEPQPLPIEIKVESNGQLALF